MGRHPSLSWTVQATELAVAAGLSDCNAWLIDLLRDGYTFLEIGDKLGVSAWRIAAYCRREGIAEYWKPKHNVIRAAEETARLAGYDSPSEMAYTLMRTKSWEETAQAMHISESTVRRFFSQYSGKPMPPGVDEFCKKHPRYVYLMQPLVAAAQRVNNMAAKRTLARLAADPDDDINLVLSEEEEEFLRARALARLLG